MVIKSFCTSFRCSISVDGHHPSRTLTFWRREMFLQVNNSDKEDWRLTNLTFFLLSLLFIYFGSPLGHLSLTKPIATLKWSLQLPNQRRCLNQWGGWILTGICNEHRPVGIDVSSPVRVCIHEALKSFDLRQDAVFCPGHAEARLEKERLAKALMRVQIHHKTAPLKPEYSVWGPNQCIYPEKVQLIL